MLIAIQPKKFVTSLWLEKFANTGSGWLIIISGSMAPLIQIKGPDFNKKNNPFSFTYWRHHHLLAGKYSGHTSRNKEIH